VKCELTYEKLIFNLSLMQEQTDQNKLLCVMANQVAEARHRLNVQEQRLVLWLVAQNKPNDSDFLTHQLNIREFEAITGTNNGNIYAEMEAITRGMLQKVLEIKNPLEKTRTAFQWFSHAKYFDNKGIIEVRFHDHLRPLLLELKKHFTHFKLETVLKFKSSYSIKFYEMLKARSFIESFTLTIEEIKDWLGIEKNEFERYADFRRFVIDHAQKELDKKADISFDYIPIKISRKIVRLKFTVKRLLQANNASKNNKFLSDEQKKLDGQRKEALKSEEIAKEKFLAMNNQERESLKKILREKTLLGHINVELKDDEIPPSYYMEFLNN
jgi:plasmid replication initiation protein